MKWTDTRQIAEALLVAHRQIDPKRIRFTDLHQWVMSLPGFQDESRRCNEKILEAIQTAWIDESE
jgi:FeS assembly protein IscX